uniref:Uncharacterized protein n=1 Tax=uncultured Chloroflexi bacterium HF0200_09I09 TaxID=710736 RepID=E0XU68_9CHLR|nr:hypothetical protein [uncultured Chloroflexi bacterium HF0200_09I09]
MLSAYVVMIESLRLLLCKSKYAASSLGELIEPVGHSELLSWFCIKATTASFGVRAMSKITPTDFNNFYTSHDAENRLAKLASSLNE